jgi:gas vesicle protein
MKAGKILIGVLSGAAAGVAAGLLLAPKKGSDTRQRIKDKSNEYVTGSRERINGFVDDVSHRFDSVKSKAMGKTKKLQSEMDGDEKIIY